MSRRQELRAPALDLKGASGVRELNERYREIFRSIVETYLATGEPVGSRNLSRHLPMTLSPASVRNVMSDLETLGLIYAPHVSAGRIPTQTGLRLFVDGLLEVGSIEDAERAQLERQLRDYARDNAAVTSEVLAEAGDMLSGLSRCAGVVLAEKQVSRIKHIEFVSLDSKRALLVLAGDDGSVENRVLNMPEGLPQQALTEATNYLNAKIRGATLPEARERIEGELKASQAELDELTARLVRSGLAQWSGGRDDNKSSYRSRSVPPAQRLEGRRGRRPHPASVRGSRIEKIADPPSRPGGKSGGRPHFYRLREQLIFPFRVFSDRRPIPGSGAQDRRRTRCDRPNSPQLCSYYPHGRFHSQARQPRVGLIIALKPPI